MSGIKNQFDETFLTDPAPYRESVGSVDADPNSVDLPIINLHLDQSATGYVRSELGFQKIGEAARVQYQRARRGYNAQLALYVLPNNGTATVVVKVWAWGSLLPTTRAEMTGAWCLVQTSTVVGNGLVMVRDVPAVPMVVTVSSLGDASAVTIFEQHTE